MRDKETITIPLNKVSYEDLEALTIEQQTQLFVKEKEIEKLKEKNEELRALYFSEEKVKEDYKSKVNKAIEMLGEWTIFETSACTDKIISETLDILKGVDKE